MKTSTTVLIAVGAVLAVVGIGSVVYADANWRGPGQGVHGPAAGMFGRGGGPGGGGPGDCGPLGGMLGGIVVKRAFELADTDQDRKLTQVEIDAARAERFAAYDADKDGRLTLTEFEALFNEVTQPATVRAFQFLDPDGDAEITLAEYEKPGARIVEMLDRNKDGTLSREDRGEPFRSGHRPGDDN